MENFPSDFRRENSQPVCAWRRLGARVSCFTVLISPGYVAELDTSDRATYYPSRLVSSASNMEISDASLIRIRTSAKPEDMEQSPTPVLVPNREITVNGMNMVAIPAGQRFVVEGEDYYPSAEFEGSHDGASLELAILDEPAEPIEPEPKPSVPIETPVKPPLEPSPETNNSKETFVSVLAAYGVPSKYIPLYIKYGEKHGVSPLLLAAQGKQESRFNPRAVSHAGAKGLAQMMPGTWRGLVQQMGLPANASPFNPDQAINAQGYFMKSLLSDAAKLKKKHNLSTGETEMALAGYNAGFGAVTKYKGVPPYKETVPYVRIIGRDYKSLRNKM